MDVKQYLLLQNVFGFFAESSRDCVSEEVSGALPSLKSLTVSVDVKHYVLLLQNVQVPGCIDTMAV